MVLESRRPATPGGRSRFFMMGFLDPFHLDPRKERSVRLPRAFRSIALRVPFNHNAKVRHLRCGLRMFNGKNWIFLVARSFWSWSFWSKSKTDEVKTATIIINIYIYLIVIKNRASEIENDHFDLDHFDHTHSRNKLEMV